MSEASDHVAHAISNHVRVHICTIPDELTQHDSMLRYWLRQHGYTVTATANDILAAKVQDAAECDICLVLLSSNSGPRDGMSCFSHCELEVYTAAAHSPEKVFAFVLHSAQRPTSVEQHDFIARLRLAAAGRCYEDIDSEEALLQHVATVLDHFPPASQTLARLTRSAPQPSQSATPDAVVVVYAAPGLHDACVELLDVLNTFGIPHRLLANSSRVPPSTVQLSRSVRQAQLVVLLEGALYGPLIPAEGLSIGEFLLNAALQMDRPIMAFTPATHAEGETQNQQKEADQRLFLARLTAHLTPDQVLHYRDNSDLQRQASQHFAALVKSGYTPLKAGGSLGTSPALSSLQDADLAAYRRRVERIFPDSFPCSEGTLPAIDHVYVMPFVHLEVPKTSTSRAKPMPVPVSIVPRHPWEGTTIRRPRPARMMSLREVQVPSRCLIRAGQGGGKTTALLQLAMHNCGGSMPVVLYLDRYARARRRGQVKNLLDAITLEEHRYIPSEADGTSPFREAAEAGRAVILLDRLDDIADEDRPRIISDICSLAGEVSTRIRILVTTSNLNLDMQMWRDFAVLDVVPLTTEQKHELAARRVSLAVKAQQAGILSAADQLPGSKERLAGSTLPLRALAYAATIAARMPHTAGVLPPVEVEIYHHLVRSCLSSLALADDEPICDGGTLQALERALSMLAFLTISHKRDRLLDEKVLRHVWHVVSPSNNKRDARHGLDLIRAAGILVEVDDNLYRFANEAIRDYLAAKWLVQRLVSSARPMKIWRFLGKEAFSLRWAHTFQLVPGILLRDFGAEGERLASDWMELLLSRASSVSSPGSLRPLAVALRAMCDCCIVSPTWAETEGVRLEHQFIATLLLQWRSMPTDNRADLRRIAELSAYLIRFSTERIIQVARRLALNAGRLRYEEVGDFLVSAISPLAHRLPITFFENMLARRLPAGSRTLLATALSELLTPLPPTLMAQLLDDEDAQVRQAAVTTAGKLGSALPLGALTHLLEHGSEFGRIALLEAAVRSGHYDSFLELLQVVRSDPSWRVRAGAMKAITGSGEAELANRLRPLDLFLSDKHSLVRSEATRALQWLAPEQAVPALWNALDDPRWQVRISALRTLVLVDPSAVGQRKWQTVYTSDICGAPYCTCAAFKFAPLANENRD